VTIFPSLTVILNFFGLIQNLQICFTNKPDKYHLESRYDFKLRSENLQRDILQLCSNLRESAQLRYLDISIHFICEFEDIDEMATVIEPIKVLRGIQNPNITVYGYQWGQTREPRWDLTEEYANYLEQLLMSPHGTIVLSAYGIRVFEDSFEPSESADENIDPGELADLSVDTEVSTRCVRHRRSNGSPRWYAKAMASLVGFLCTYSIVRR
jgi:hypothetical protein